GELVHHLVERRLGVRQAGQPLELRGVVLATTGEDEVVIHHHQRVLAHGDVLVQDELAHVGDALLPVHENGVALVLPAVSLVLVAHQPRPVPPVRRQGLPGALALPSVRGDVERHLVGGHASYPFQDRSALRAAGFSFSHRCRASGAVARSMSCTRWSLASGSLAFSSSSKSCRMFSTVSTCARGPRPRTVLSVHRSMSSVAL